MITKDDVVIAISYSGTTSELLTIIPTVIREGAPVISITGSDSATRWQRKQPSISTYMFHEKLAL